MNSTLDWLARQILTVDEEGNSFVPEYLSIIQNGLHQIAANQEQKKVLIIGAGIAGLLAGKLLKDAGFQVTILEANKNRVGGRVKTFHHKPKTFHNEEEKQIFENPNQYAEAGAMRIPTVHLLVQALIEKLGLKDKVRPFYNVDVAKHNPQEKTFRTWLKTNGELNRREQYNNSKFPAKEVGFPVIEEFQDATSSQLLAAALECLKSKVDPSLSIRQRIEGWKEIIDKYDDFSMHNYLKKVGLFRT